MKSSTELFSVFISRVSSINIYLLRCRKSILFCLFYPIIVSNLALLQRQGQMSWRSIAGHAMEQMLYSWRFAAQANQAQVNMGGGSEGKVAAAEAIWKGQSNCTLTYKALSAAFTQVTSNSVSSLQANINGQLTQDLNIPLADGMFNQYQTDILNPLRQSTFIAYKFGPIQHYCTFVLNQDLGIWVPLQGWNGVITLADWVRTFDDNDNGGMDDALTKMKQTAGINPIDNPKTYWAYFWNDFSDRFSKTQLNGDALAQIKQEKLQNIQNCSVAFNSYIHSINRVICDGS